MLETQNSASHPLISLSYAHWLALSSFLFTVEEDCRETERWLDGVQGIFFESSGELSDTTKQCVRAKLSQILGRLSRIKDDLALQKKQIDLRRQIGARLDHMWVAFHEAKSRYLKAYGAVPEEVKNYVDPRMDELLSLLANVRSLLLAREEEG